MTDSSNNHPADSWTRLLAEKLRHLRYGTIQLTVHDGRIVQMDCTERTRLPADAAPTHHAKN